MNKQKIYRQIASHRGYTKTKLHFMVRSEYARAGVRQYKSLRKQGYSPIAAREQVLLSVLWCQYGDF